MNTCYCSCFRSSNNSLIGVFFSLTKQIPLILGTRFIHCCVMETWVFQAVLGSHMVIFYSSTKGSDRATDIQKRTRLRCIQNTVLVWISLPERCIGRDLDHINIDTSAIHIIC